MITHSAGGIVLNPKGDVLLVNQNGDSWSLPKGHVEPGESARSAAEREIYEESGVKNLRFVKKLGQYQRPRIARGGAGEDISEMKSITIFLFHSNQTTLTPIDRENPEARWVPRKDVTSFLTHPKDREFFLKVEKELL